jgi:hypothetical protein
MVDELSFAAVLDDLDDSVDDIVAELDSFRRGGGRGGRESNSGRDKSGRFFAGLELRARGSLLFKTWTIGSFCFSSTLRLS